MLRFVDRTHNEQPGSVGVNQKSRKIEIEGLMIQILVIDKYDSERLQSAWRMDGIMVVYDTSDPSSFQLAQQEWNTIKKHSTCRMMIGNKSDLVDAKAVDTEIAEEFLENGRDSKSSLMETSAKTGTNVDQAFTTLAKAILEKKIASGEVNIPDVGGLRPASPRGPSNNNNNNNEKTAKNKEKKEGGCCLS